MARHRIQKVLATAGLGSRRACESLVERGRVTVNGRKVRELPCLIDPSKDSVCVDRKPIRTAKLVYYLLNKPPGVLCTNADPQGRRRAVDLLTGVRERLFPVGRLDADSMGLLILTNDGALTQKLTHPKFQTPKTYRVEITGQPNPDAIARLRKGVWLSEGRTAPPAVTVIHRQTNKTIIEITLREGRNREVRRILAKLGHKVRRLNRIRMGKLSIRKLPLGAFRPLTDAEIRYLHRLADTHADRSAGHGDRNALTPHRSTKPKQAPATERPRKSSPARSTPRTRRAALKKGQPVGPSSPRKTETRRGPEAGQGLRGGRRIILPEK